jgi:hypothetical protein
MDHQARMDISRGFQIERPEIFVPWETSEAELQQLFIGLPLRHVTHGYFTTQCESIGGLSHELGFHFHPRGGGILVELEFFSKSYPDLATSYQEFQQHLEMTFSQPTLTTSALEGFPSHTWRLSGADIVHFVQERFGPEEHVRIKRRAV